MSAVAARRIPTHHDTGTSRFAICLFVIAEIMFFAALVAAYIVMSFTSSVWKPEGFEREAYGLPLANTLGLMLSGFFLFAGSRGIQREDPARLTICVGLTFLLGAVFVVGQAFEFRRLLDGVLPLAEGDQFGSIFYAMAGLHAVHVAGGVLLLLYVLVKAILGRYHQRRRRSVDLACAYWGLVVVVWIFFYLILYVL